MKQLYMKHLIIKCDRDLRIKDWTPFSNLDTILKTDLIFKGDLITTILDRLILYNWTYKDTFNANNNIYFLLINDN